MRALKRGDMLQWYRIDRVLGRGGFGITYLATDTNLDHLVAIKEYAPDSQVERTEDNSLNPVSQDVDDSYRVGLERFIKEARTLVKFNHPSIVRIITVFEHNKTAYLVMDYEEGEVFKDYIVRTGLVPEARLKDIFLRLIDGLAQVHDRGFLHRDIKPANLIIRKDGSPVLLDFGCARPALLGNQTTHTAFVSVGYSPLEQFHAVPGMEEGPWTDIYALSATLHYAISRQTPPNSASRLAAMSAKLSDPLLPAAELGAGHYSEAFLNAVDWGLKTQISDRPATLAQWRAALTAHPAADDDKTLFVPHGNRVPPASDRIAPEQPAPRSRPAQRRSVAPQRAASQYDQPTSVDEPWDDIRTEVHAERVTPAPRRSGLAVVATATAALAVTGLGTWYWLSQNATPPAQVADSAQQRAAQPLAADNAEQQQAKEQQAEQQRLAREQQQAEQQRLAREQQQAEQQRLAREQQQAEAQRRQQLDNIDASIARADLAAARDGIAALQGQGYQSAELDQLTRALGAAEREQAIVAGAEQAMLAGDYDKALGDLDGLDQQSIFSDRAAALRDEIETAQAVTAARLEKLRAEAAARDAKEQREAQQQREQQVAELVDSAERALLGGSVALARESIAQIRSLDPQHEQLASLDEQLQRAVRDQRTLDQVGQALRSGDIARSRELLDSVAQSGRATDRMAALEEQVAAAEAQASAAAAKVEDALKLAGQQSASRQWPEATESYQLALELDPDNRRAQQGLQTLERDWLAQIDSAVRAANYASAKRSLTALEARFGASDGSRALTSRIDSAQRAGDEARRQIANVRRLLDDAEYQRALAALDGISSTDGRASQIDSLRREARAGLQARQAQRDRAEARRQQARDEQQKAQQPAAPPAPPAFVSALSEAQRLLATSDLPGAERALDRAKALGAPDSTLRPLRQRHDALVASANSFDLTDQHVREAKQQFERLAQAVVNRNLRAVDQLTTANQDKLDLVTALVGRAAKMNVRIKDVVPDSQSKKISAVLEFQDMLLPNGQTFIPAASYREHPISLELIQSGWSKIIW